MKKYTFLLLLLISFSGYAQQTINNFKYVLVPEKFSFLREPNQYRLNTLAKALLEEKGFTVYYDNTELPQEIANNKCAALNLEVVEKKGMFTTNLTVLLKDCRSNTVFKGKEGKSREKEFSTSYNAALRDAFTSLTDLPYAYVPDNTAVKSVQVMVAPPVPPSVSAPTVQQEAKVVSVASTEGTLYAQPTATGFQLIDTTPKKVLTLFRTSVQDYFIADSGSANGIVFKKNGEWFFEYYKDGSLNAEKLSVKF